MLSKYLQNIWKLGDFMNKKLISLLVALLVPQISLAEIRAPIDLAIVCNVGTPASDKMFIEADATVSGYNERTCVEKSSYIRGVIVNKIDLRYAKSIDAYALFLHTDMAMNKMIFEETEKNIARNIAIIKNNKLIIYGVIGAPVTNGIIPIGVPSKEIGELIGNDIGGKKGQAVTSSVGSP